METLDIAHGYYYSDRCTNYFRSGKAVHYPYTPLISSCADANKIVVIFAEVLPERFCRAAPSLPERI